jgi:hypothetical protein
MIRRRPTGPRPIHCYLCGHGFEVSARAMSTTCPACNKAIKVEDVVVKSYLPVTDLQTCGRISVTARGRVAAKRVCGGGGIECKGAIEGSIDTEGVVSFGPKATWKGGTLRSDHLEIAEGASLDGRIEVPARRSGG